MVIKKETLKKSGLLWILFLILSGPLFTETIGYAATGANNVPNLVSERYQSEILSLLGQRIENQQIMDKAREKLQSLDDEQLRLIASLSERIMLNRSAGADVAYLLWAALIILS